MIKILLIVLTLMISTFSYSCTHSENSIDSALLKPNSCLIDSNSIKKEVRKTAPQDDLFGSYIALFIVIACFIAGGKIRN